MRESVKNKRKLTAIVIVISLLLSVTIGLLASLMGGSIKNDLIPSDGIGNVAAQTWTTSGIGTIPDDQKVTTGGTAISSASDLKKYILACNSLENAAKQGVGRLTGNITGFKWETSDDSNIVNNMSRATFYGHIEGNGYKVELASNQTSWPSSNVDKQAITSTTTNDSDNSQGTIYCSALFIAINKGTIQNINFEMSGKTIRCNADANRIWVAGIVCGENSAGATIQNVTLNVNSSTINFHFNTGMTNNSYQNKIIAGGIVGKQSGTLHRVYANYTGTADEEGKRTKFSVDSKYNETGVYPKKKALHYSSVGGIYGAWENTSAAQTTSNLMVKANEYVEFNASSSGSSNGDWVFNTIGAIAGVSLRGVQGIVWDFRGKFTVPNCRAINNGNNWYIEKEYGPNTEKSHSDGTKFDSTHCAPAYCGLGAGYYSPYNKTLVLNGNSAAESFAGNIFSTNRGRIPFPDNDIVDGASVRYTVDKTALSYKDNAHIDKINTSNFDYTACDVANEGFDISFTDVLGEIRIKKTLSTNDAGKSYVNVYWIAAAQGRTPDVRFDSDNNTSLDATFNIVSSSYSISSGKIFNKRLDQDLGTPTYTGRDYIDLFAAQALSSLKKESGLAEIVFNRDNVEFRVDGDRNKVVSSLITPNSYKNVHIVSTDSNKYSYVDMDYRIALQPTVIETMAVNSALFDTPVYNKDKWETEKEITFKIRQQSTTNTLIVTNSANKLIDEIRYRKVGDTDYKSITGLQYSNTEIANNGVKFTFKESTEGANGWDYEFIAYCNGAPVAYNANVTPISLPNIKIDSVLPEITNFGGIYDHNGDSWALSTFSDGITVSDKNSGIIKSNITFKERLCNDDPNEHGQSTFGNERVLEANEFNFSNGMITKEFTTHAMYQIIVADQAGNSVQTEWFTVKVDSETPVIRSVAYYTDYNCTVPYVFDQNNPNKKTVYAKVTAKLGHAGGSLYFYARDDKGDENTSDTVIERQVVRDTQGSGSVSIFIAEIKKTWKPTDASGNIDLTDYRNYYNFVVTSAAGDKNAEDPALRPKDSGVYDQNNDIVFVDQYTIKITMDNIIISTLTKVYDGTNVLKSKNDVSSNFKVHILGEYYTSQDDEDSGDVGRKRDINGDIEYEAEFIEGYTGGGTDWTRKPDANLALTLIVRIHVKKSDTLNFAIENNQTQNNIYPYTIDGSTMLGHDGTEMHYNIGVEGNYTIYDYASVQANNLEIGIRQKMLTSLKANNVSTTYGRVNFGVMSYTFDKNELAVPDQGKHQLNVTYKFRGIQPNEKSNAGEYIYYPLLETDKNYCLYDETQAGGRGQEDIFEAIKGVFTIKKFEINYINIQNEINSITCFEVPNVQASFIGVEGYPIPLKVIYKNTDREEYEFIEGRRNPLGQYFYIILLDDTKDENGVSILTNYVNVGDANRLIGRFSVVGDSVEGNFSIKGLNKDTKIITVEYTNHLIDMRSLITFKDIALSAKMKIYYGADQDSEVTNILGLGSYMVTLIVRRGDNRYLPFTGEYTVNVIPAEIEASNDDMLVQKDNDNADGITFNNTPVNYAPTNKYFTEDLLERLNAYLPAGKNFNDFYKFDFKYYRGKTTANPIDADNVKNVGEYVVAVTISGSVIQPISLQTNIKILTKIYRIDNSWINVVDKNGNLINIISDGTTDNTDERAVKYNANTNTYSKVFSGKSDLDIFYFALKREIRNELNAMFGVTDKSIERDIPYEFNRNGFMLVNDSNENIKFGYKFGVINNNVQFIQDDSWTVRIEQKIIDLDIEKVEEVFKGGTTILLTEADIAALIKNGIEDPYMLHEEGIQKGINTLYFGVENYPNSGIEIIKEKPSNSNPNDIVTGGKIGLRIPNAGKYNIQIRMREPDPNFRIGNGFIEIDIKQVSIKDTFQVEGRYSGLENHLMTSEGWTVEFVNGEMTFAIGAKGWALLHELNVDSNKVEFEKYQIINGEAIKVDSIVNAGRYRYVVVFNNDNILESRLTFDITINKAVIKDKVDYVATYNYGQTAIVDKDTKVFNYNYNGSGLDISFSDRGMATLEKLGVDAENQIIFTKQSYIDGNYEDVDGEIINVGRYFYTIDIENDNISDRKFVVDVNISKANIKNLGVTYFAVHGGDKTSLNDKGLNIDFSNDPVTFSIEGTEILEKLHIADKISYEIKLANSEEKVTEVKNAGQYVLTYTIDSNNIADNKFVADIVINKANIKNLGVTYFAKHGKDSIKETLTEYGLDITFSNNDVTFDIDGKDILEGLGIDINKQVSIEINGEEAKPIRNADNYIFTVTIDSNNIADNKFEAEIVINKAAVSDVVTFYASYYKNGEWLEKLLTAEGLSIDYTGNVVKTYISEEGKKELINFGVASNEISYSYKKADNSGNVTVDEIKNAGNYLLVITIENPNIDSEPLEIAIVVNKKKLGEYTGVFNPNIWLIDGKAPNEDQEENGIMYTRYKDGTTAVYSMKLVDEAELVASGFKVVYKYDGVECDGVSLAGDHRVTAEIYYQGADAENWEVKIVELWNMDSNGEFVYVNQTINTDADGNVKGPNDNTQIIKVKQVISFKVAKADLQADIEVLGELKTTPRLDPDDPEYNPDKPDNTTVTYNGEPRRLSFWETQTEIFETNHLIVKMNGNGFINAGDYAVVATFYKVLEDGYTLDPNYEPTEVEASLTINPIPVKIIYEVDEKFIKNGKVVYNEGEPITISAYYVDRFNNKVKIENFTFETVRGEGDDKEYGSADLEKMLPGRYQVTANIKDSNYAYDEEDMVNFLEFSIYNRTKAVNTTLYILLVIGIILVVSTGLVILYMFRMFNPAVQEVDLDD